jgi:ABC-type branched-subunit amino acid transport system ATPase component
MGARVVLLKLMAFALSGALAGVAGVCFALVTQRFQAVTFDPSLSLLVVAMVIIGGLGTIEGALLGALYLIGIPAAFGSGPTVQFITSGVGLVLFLMYLPDGLAGVLHRALDWMADRLPAGATEPSAAAPTREPEPPGAGALLRIHEVSVAFGGLHAVDDVCVSIDAGEVLGVIGPNGSGKTTLLDAISGLVAHSGGIHVDGEDLVDYQPADRAWLGVMRSFQDCRLFPELTVEETLLVAEDARRPVRLGATTLRTPAARTLEREKRAVVDELIDGLHLEPFRYRLISELSTGTRRIVDLAVVLAAHPRVLLLDEPTAGLAQREAEAFGPLLRRIREITGATIVIVEHDVPLTLSLCDRLMVMEAGRVVSVGPPKAVLEDPAAIAAYLGASAEALARSGTGASRPTMAGMGRTKR